VRLKQRPVFCRAPLHPLLEGLLVDKVDGASLLPAIGGDESGEVDHG